MKLDEIISEKGNTTNQLDNGNMQFSMEPLIRYLDERIAASKDKSILIQYKKNILDQFENKNDLTISFEKAKDYKNLFKTIYSLLTNPLADESQYCWGISFPLSSQIVFSTEAFQHLMTNMTSKHLVGVEHFRAACTFSEVEAKKIFIYAFIIKRLYNLDIFNTSAMVFKTMQNGIEKYYHFNINNQFIDVEYKGELPQIDATMIEEDDVSEESALEWLEREMPLKNVKMTGFSYVELTDITEKIEKAMLHSLFLTSNLGLESQNQISEMVQKLVGCSSLDVLMLPILYINDRLVTETWQTVEPKIEQLQKKYHISPEAFNEAVNEYSRNPKLIFRENIQESKDRNTDVSIFTASNIMQGVIVKPIFSKKKLIGIVLIASDNINVISKQILIYAEEAVPIIENLFETAIGNYLTQLDKVIKSKFTSIQPSVEWKFNEVALQYIRDKQRDDHPALLPIKFKDIYPLYGAIDFRNSTIERNSAEIEDKIAQLEFLIKTINDIKKIVPIDLLSEWKFQAKQWIETLEDGLDASQEFTLNQFLEKESMDMLQELEDTDPRVHQIIQPYLEGIAPNGQFHKNSIALEKTFKILNANIAAILDQMNDKLQEAYPSYFERYRTDGIEFNIYIGQSITPNKPFNKIYLRNAQLWQLNTMALIAKITGQSQDNLPRKILTTQLIFVHSNTITTSFRLDERRFDVEGSYNIRYEIIKKRIDKALVKGTNERLTQPGKIAIVYFQKKDIEDYITHIKYLQKNNILADNIESLELEDMQGVSGLRALRVSVSDYPLLENDAKRLLLDNLVTNKKIAVPHQK
ncbi:MAG: hypothetical protein DI598_14370 [Pseudopedobacter saltans]|uniref:GAF domain-containing protein n=1 Tax=Pseudopedobacter saltans TaxID=151895 RepID=A0A2W5ET35_9SPHI|nr:MAG: hypothetical protein DI598_14370 [Pseudopedobacter saltans]